MKYFDDLIGEEIDSEFTILLSMIDDTTNITDAEIDRLESELGNGWTVRRPYGGEADGIYYTKPNGAQQILGYSLPVPAQVHEHIRQAFTRAFIV